MKESKTELATHISKGGHCLSPPKLGLSSCHELHVSLPSTGAFNSQTLYSMYGAVFLVIAVFSLTPTIQK